MTIARRGVTRCGNRTRLTDCFSQFITVSPRETGAGRGMVAVDKEDLLLWQGSRELLVSLHDRMAGDHGRQWSELLERYSSLKVRMATLIADVEAAGICGACGGLCCMNGKYRINALDALCGVAVNVSPTVDFCQSPLCPYGTDAGCSLSAPLRPADCILFICDAIDQKLSIPSRSELVRLEQQVRECLREASSVAGELLGTPLLLWGEKKLVSKSSE